VKQLPGLPEGLRSSQVGTLACPSAVDEVANGSTDFRSTLLRSGNHALSLTATQAFTWDYTSAGSAPPTRTFQLPHPSDAEQPLPLGSFVTASQASETGLLVVNATNGKITYWESIENADALSLFEQRRNGVDGSCGSLLSGEIVTEIVSAAHTGFLLCFSSGRVAHLLLRDAQSKPSIKVNFFRTQQSAVGLFGGLKTVLGGADWVKKVTAVRTRPGQLRGEIEAVTSTSEAQFHSWSLSLSNQVTQKVECDAKLAVSAAVSEALRLENAGFDGQHTDMKVLDFAIITVPSDVRGALVTSNHGESAGSDLDIVVLVQASNSNSSKYALVEIKIVEGQANVRRTISLHSYTEPLFTQNNGKPRICLSTSNATAFIVFEKAIVLVSLATLHSSPEAQLRADSGDIPEAFQDTIYFREDGNYSIVGASAEAGLTRNTHCSILAMVKGCGLIRVTMAEPIEEQSSIERVKITVKDKIEQAVFYGAMRTNPLDLSRESALAFPLDEVEEAVLKISHEVCATETDLVTSVAPSIQFHLEQRAKVLNDLAGIIKRTYPDISRVTRWKLRWNAEKMAAARAVWSSYDEKPKDGKPSRLLSRILWLMNERHKTEVDSDMGERDQVRQWFLKDVWRMQNLVAWAYRAIHELTTNDEIEDTATYFELLSDASDITINALETAYAFRDECAALYGLENEESNGGILENGYEGLPPCWTSIPELLLVFPEGVQQARQKILSQAPEDEQLLIKLARDQPRLTDLYCKCSEERYRSYLAADNEQTRAQAEPFRREHMKLRTQMIVQLADFQLAVDGMTIAEKYVDMQALVNLVRIQLVEDMSGATQEEQATHISTLQKRIDKYFRSYGAEWAGPWYSAMIIDRQYKSLLNQPIACRKHLTTFLHARPRRKKLSWINDALSEDDFQTASQCLKEIAEEQEDDLWRKKVELSLSSLALAADPDSSVTENGIAVLSQQQVALQVVHIQERLYAHIRPSLYDAVDQAAELQIAMEHFGRHVVKGKLAFQAILQQGFDMLTKHVAIGTDLLIDTLTLMDQRQSEQRSHDMAGLEFVFALQVLKCSAATQESGLNEQTLKIIWRRCFNRDGWKVLDAAARKSDHEATSELEATILFKTIYEGYAAGTFIYP